MLGAFQVVAPHISSLWDYMSVAYRSSFRPKSRQGRNILNRDNLKCTLNAYIQLIY